MILRFWHYLKNNQWLGLSVILIIAGWLRLTGIESIPNGLYWDEAVITYDAWGISIDGRDQWGKFMPIIFRSFGDGKMPFTHYVLAGIYKVFGFSLMGIRYLTAIWGILLVAGIYFLTKKLAVKTSAPAFLAALLMATSSWAIHFSRFGLEAMVAVSLLVWGGYLLYQSKNRLSSMIGVILLVLSSYTYHASLIVAPLILLLLGWKKVRILVFLVLLIPLIVALQQSGWSRMEQTSFWNDSEFNHSISSYVTEAVARLAANLNPLFWTQGGQPNWRQSVPGFFPLFWIDVLFLFIGLVKSPRILRGWLVLGLIPSIVGVVSPHTIRLMGVLPAIKIIEAYGWHGIYRKFKPVAIMAGLVYLVNFGYFWQYYKTDYALSSAADFQYGYGELMLWLKEKTDIYSDNYVISPHYGQPYVYTLLYWKISPPEFRSGGLANVSFRPIQWPELSGKIVYAGMPSEIPVSDPRVTGIIYDSGGQNPIWVIAK